MNKKVLLLFVTAMLSIMGAKADVIPSSYYSEPAAGTYYLYNVTAGKFLRTVGVSEKNYSLLDAPVAVTLTSKGETICKGGGDYILSGNTDNFIKIGYWGGQWLWSNAVSGNADILAWTFNSNGTKTYTMSITLSEAFSQNNATLVAGTYYMKDVTNLGSEAEAGTYALITEANYYAFLASTSMIPATYYTETPAAGSYYLYNVKQGGFLYRGGDGNYAGLKTIPATLTLTSNGSGKYYIMFSDGKYLKTGSAYGYDVWTDATDESFAWTFETFHDLSGLFFVKCPLNDVDRYLYSNNIGARGVNGKTTPDSDTNCAWALISAEDYDSWQNSFVLDETNAVGFSSTRDIYNVNPTVNRTMTANVWNTLVVPFDMAIPSGWTVMEPTEFEDGTLTFGTASSIKAGIPYIVKPEETVTSFSATGVTLKKDLDPTTVGSGTTVTMTGTYEQIAAIDYSTQDSYIIGIKNGVSSLYKVNSSISLKPFRAYFTISGSAGARITLNFDEDATGIDFLETESANDNKDMKDGKYLENGKIVIVKNGVKYSANGQIVK